MSNWPFYAIALGYAGLFLRTELAKRDAKAERAKTTQLETVLAARIEAEEQAKAQAYCEGWENRKTFEECARAEQLHALVRYRRGMAN